MTAPSAAPAAPHRSLRRLHRPALLGWAAFVLLLLGLAVGALGGIALGRTLPALGAAAVVTLVIRLYLREAWQPLRGPLHGFWAVRLLATAMVLAAAAAATAGAFSLLRRRTR